MPSGSRNDDEILVEPPIDKKVGVGSAEPRHAPSRASLSGTAPTQTQIEQKLLASPPPHSLHLRGETQATPPAVVEAPEEPLREEEEIAKFLDPREDFKDDVLRDEKEEDGIDKEKERLEDLGKLADAKEAFLPDNEKEEEAVKQPEPEVVQPLATGPIPLEDERAEDGRNDVLAEQGDKVVEEEEKPDEAVKAEVPKEQEAAKIQEEQPKVEEQELKKDPGTETGVRTPPAGQGVPAAPPATPTPTPEAVVEVKEKEKQNVAIVVEDEGREDARHPEIAKEEPEEQEEARPETVRTQTPELAKAESVGKATQGNVDAEDTTKPKTFTPTQPVNQHPNATRTVSAEPQRPSVFANVLEELKRAAGENSTAPATTQKFRASVTQTPHPRVHEASTQAQANPATAKPPQSSIDAPEGKTNPMGTHTRINVITQTPRPVKVDTAAVAEKSAMPIPGKAYKLGLDKRTLTATQNVGKIEPTASANITTKPTTINTTTDVAPPQTTNQTKVVAPSAPIDAPTGNNVTIREENISTTTITKNQSQTKEGMLQVANVATKTPTADAVKPIGNETKFQGQQQAGTSAVETKKTDTKTKMSENVAIAVGVSVSTTRSVVHVNEDVKAEKKTPIVEVKKEESGNNATTITQTQNEENQPPARNVLTIETEEFGNLTIATDEGAETIASKLLAVLPPRGKPITFTHIVNAFNTTELQYQWTFKALASAVEHVEQINAVAETPEVSAEVIVVVEESSNVTVPAALRVVEIPKRDLPDELKSTDPNTRRLPRIRDILRAAYTQGHGDWVVLTNFDIVVVQKFYTKVATLLKTRTGEWEKELAEGWTGGNEDVNGEEQRFVALSLLKDDIVVDKEEAEPWTLDDVLSTLKISQHHGHDTFVFPRAWIPYLCLDRLPIGVPPWGDFLFYQLGKITSLLASVVTEGQDKRDALVASSVPFIGLTRHVKVVDPFHHTSAAQSLRSVAHRFAEEAVAKCVWPLDVSEWQSKVNKF